MSVEVKPSKLDGVLELVPRRHCDDRGFFVELWNRRSLSAIGIDAEFVQDNLATSIDRGTVRGLHFQAAPSAQGKLVWVPRGAAFDVVVDVRPGSASLGRHAAHVLSAERGNQLWIPPGFAHGYCTLEKMTEVAYKVTSFYDPAAERGIRWNDPDLAIEWPVGESDAILSVKDGFLPTLVEWSRQG